MNSHLELEVYASENGETNSLCEARNGGVAEETENKNSSTRSLFSVVNKLLDDSIERKTGDITQGMAFLLKKVVQEIEQRVSTQAEYFKKQNNLYKVLEEKYQSRMRVIETLAIGTYEKNEIEKTKIEENKKVYEQYILRITKEKDHSDIQISALKQELELAKNTYEKRCLQLETQKLMELECLLTDFRNKVKELEVFSQSKSLRWRKKKHGYKSILDSQFGSLQGLRVTSESIKREVLKTQRIYSEEFHHLGVKLKGLIVAAENYHTVLAENMKLYNEVQDLKGNIRVYCQIRPFLPGQSKKRTTIEYIGENGELVVANPLKQGKDSHRLFKFNKVFGPEASQEEVFLDTGPLIQSVLDGYNVCIFAYGQTGSGKTYTMYYILHSYVYYSQNGPNLSSKGDWGVNYRALNDLFHISQSRKNSIAYEVGVQMVEIYNEQVRDLLSSDTSQKRYPFHHVLELMTIGLMNRSRGALGRAKEAQHINKSLSALGDVVFALAQKSPHVPYRNSKITQVLQSSLGGQAKTLMFVQLNPDVESYSETISTLKFAERVSGVELGAAQSNKEGRGVRELMDKVASLKDAVTKKDEEIGKLRLVKTSVNDERQGMSSPRRGSSSPRRHSIGSSRQSRALPGGKRFGHAEKAVYDRDNSSEYSDKHSKAETDGSLNSIVEFTLFPETAKLRIDSAEK
ncbi:Kinesin-like protein KIN-14J [Camellia lanceoleosa]|nr:Kinesin-like protein KIN-14J [Camellia lanceoleosa]